MYQVQPSDKIKREIEELFQIHARKVQILSYLAIHTILYKITFPNKS